MERVNQSAPPPSFVAQRSSGNDIKQEPHDSAFYDRITRAWQTCQQKLLSEQTDDGHWVGQLSRSALSTATAISALVLCRLNDCLPSALWQTANRSIDGGRLWLLEHQNEDGGWGDTDRSHSNIATSLLVIAALRLVDGAASDNSPAVVRAWQYVDRHGKWEGLRQRYGKDKTFVVPILSNCALAGLVPWSMVSALPFEAAWLPQQWYRWARMPVVSYAVPALVAIGQARFHFAPPRFLALRWLRQAAVNPTLRVLERMQPASGGYLEATPLTSFVLMNLAAIGRGNSSVAQNCIRFLVDSRLPDCSWPIDTNLATWATSLAWHGLSRVHPIRIAAQINSSDSQTNLLQDSKFEVLRSGNVNSKLNQSPEISVSGLTWLLNCQHRQPHPFTGATPGGWGWTDLSGAVPDADDTPAALLALGEIDWQTESAQAIKPQAFQAVGLGLRWLVQLQNHDGGWPTFCRGWGKLPFDRSGTDLTAHSLRAIERWSGRLSELASYSQAVPSAAVLARAKQRGLRFIQRRQRSDGSWLPLWFGNQDYHEEENPFYGTGKVLLALAQLDLGDSLMARRGCEFVRVSQNRDGGWGGSSPTCQTAAFQGDRISSIEETAIVLEGLIHCCSQNSSDSTIMRGLDWLVEAIEQGGLDRAQPIGFYFAKLWYYEKLYPVLFGLGSLGSAIGRWR